MNQSPCVAIFFFLYCAILIHSLQKALHALNYNLYPVMEPSEGQVLLCVALMNHYFCTCFVHLIKRTCFAPVICLVTLVPCMQTEKVIISRWSFSHSACSWALQQRVLLVAPCCHYTLFLFVVKCCLQTINSLSFNVQELALILCKYCKKIWNITIRLACNTCLNIGVPCTRIWHSIHVSNFFIDMMAAKSISRDEASAQM